MCFIIQFLRQINFLSYQHKVTTVEPGSTYDHLSTTGAILHPELPMTATSLQQPLSSVTKLTIMERYHCIPLINMILLHTAAHSWSYHWRYSLLQLCWEASCRWSQQLCTWKHGTHFTKTNESRWSGKQEQSRIYWR